MAQKRCRIEWVSWLSLDHRWLAGLILAKTVLLLFFFLLNQHLKHTGNVTQELRFELLLKFTNLKQEVTLISYMQIETRAEYQLSLLDGAGVLQLDTIRTQVTQVKEISSWLL